ncbi:hypothetical protein RND81_09G081800 [Saponaria officinalis]|uniref:Endonuclease/exonuclease/phosphatase domain-containing protein n=1 Tax=Saponaria officinalis TaxID=3572 RepID=A0AAW1IIB3_SAPOF
MNLLSLNCRGLGSLDAVGALRDLLKREASAFVFLCETKLSGREMKKFRLKCEGRDGMEVDSVGRSGGLAFIWRRGMQCEFRSASRVTSFYGWPAVADRHLSWKLLCLLGRQSSLPWVCVGDFNEILYATEMKGGSRAQWQMNNFREAADTQAEEANRQSRLDRAMCTGTWSDLFPYAKLLHMGREWSDHAPSKLLLNGRVEREKSSKIFRFVQLWVGMEGCEEVIVNGGENGGGDLIATLDACASGLVRWKVVNIGKIVREINKKRRQLDRLNEGGRLAVQI